jgi:hypothetical protein
MMRVTSKKIESIDEELRVLEERLAMPAASESKESLAALFAPEFREFGSDGRVYADVASLLETLVPGDATPVLLEEFRTLPVGADTVLVTYRSKSLPGLGWKPPTLRSSLWVMRQAGWQLVFHQGTKLGRERS